MPEPTRVPSVPQLGNVYARLANFLNTCGEFRVWIEDDIEPGCRLADATGFFMASSAVLFSLARLEESINPLRLPFDDARRRGITVCGWPTGVMVVYPKLRAIVDQIIERWDVPEICDDRSIMTGSFGVETKDENGQVLRDENGQIQYTRVDRQRRPYTLANEQRERLLRCFATVESALEKALSPEDIEESTPAPSGTEAPPRRARSSPEPLNPGSKALAAALDLRKSGLRVSVKAACARVGVDRKHLRERYPDVVTAINALAAPDRTIRRGTRDRRSGNLDAVDEIEG